MKMRCMVSKYIDYLLLTHVGSRDYLISEEKSIDKWRLSGELQFSCLKLTSVNIRLDSSEV